MYQAPNFSAAARQAGSAVFLTTTHRGREIPVGRLEYDTDHYLFRYTCGALEITPVAGFMPLPEFPRLTQRYESRTLFTTFARSLPKLDTPEGSAALRLRGLPTIAIDPMAFLAVPAPLASDAKFSTQPCIRRTIDGYATIHVLLNGPDPTSSAAQRLAAGQALFPKSLLRDGGKAVDVILIDAAYDVVTMLPPWLATEIAPLLPKRAEIAVHVVQVNPPPVPDSQRLLVRIAGLFPPSFAPMQAKWYTPILV